MRYLFIIIVTVLSASLSYAQTYEIFQDPEETGVHNPRIRSTKESDLVDSVKNKDKHPKRGPKDLDKGNRTALDPLLGYSEGHANSIIRLYDHTTLIDHELYPYIRKVIEVTNVLRWGHPVKLYFFIDSAFRVCRMNYVLAVLDGMPPDSAHAITGYLRNKYPELEDASDNEWEIAGWQDKNSTAIYTWQKNIPSVRPAYILTLKSYMDDHLLPYTNDHGWPKDGIFTVIKEK